MRKNKNKMPSGTLNRSGLAAIRMDKLIPYLFIAPIFLTIIIFVLYPLLFGVAKSFYRYGGMQNQFIWFDNYIECLTDKTFWYSMWNVFKFWLFLHVCFGSTILAARLTCNITNPKLKSFVRVLFLLPLVVPSSLVMLLWKFVYYPEIGVLAHLYEAFGKVYPDFLWNPKTSFWAICFVAFPWVNATNYIFFFTAFDGIDREIIDAAKIDGATGIKAFIKIEMPAIKHIFQILYISVTMAQINSFENILLLTNGGPDNKTMVPGLYIYQQSFNSAIEPRQGYSCAVSMILFFITMFIMKIIFKDWGKDDE